jgi:very-short-patch-repair endonuclease/gamma-glutamylcyclotransferase (GGCT)/AIG2-like uncharacterized protein YtfP
MHVPRDKSNRLKQYARDMRREQPDAERKLWEHLRKHRLEGFRFRRQHPIEGFIVDFYCVSAHLAIELDGGQHFDADAVDYDQARTEKLKSLGVRVVRFSDVDVLKDTDVVVEEIYRTLTDGPPPQPSPGVPGEGEEAAAPSESRDLLFIYGSLLPGMEPRAMTDIVRRLNFICDATIRGKLYDFGPFPGVLLDESAGVVKGRIVEVPCECWDRLDQYESCPLPDSVDGLYRRVKSTATRDDGEPIECWVYVYNRDVSQAKLVECGCWLTHRGLPKIMPS